MPDGPYSLWPENTKKSQSSACTSIGMCWTAWQASISTGTPRACASADDLARPG